jgi:hypothetical protein
MSPSESQLRAALQDGEGDAPDATALISHALQVRRDRRNRITSIAGGVAVVAVLGVGTTALVSLGTDSGSSGGSSADSARGFQSAQKAAGAASAPSAERRSAAASPARPSKTAAASTGGTIDALKCPTTPARYMLPGGGGSGQFGSGNPLFPDAVAAIKACGYSTSPGARPQAHVYQSPESSAIATALESAPTTHTSRMCADNTYARGTIEILAVDSRGRALKPVVITLNCQASQATNGTAVRYVNAVPDQLLELVH